MQTIISANELTHKIEELKAQSKTIGFVPTMGALHQGHLSLVTQAQKECDVVVASIFVNPKQFNDKNDFKLYPRTEQRDLQQLEDAGVAIVFTPTVEEVYPPDYQAPNITFNHLENKMEGAQRPGHFAGVAAVVNRFFEVIMPHRAYFGKKDYQQLVIIRHLVSKLNFPITIVACPISREENGLARSSRNERLSDDARQLAGVVFHTLVWAKEHVHQFSPQELSRKIIDQINKPGIQIEYIQIADAENLEEINVWEADRQAVVFAAITLEGVRLIDNMPLF